VRSPFRSLRSLINFGAVAPVTVFSLFTSYSYKNLLQIKDNILSKIVYFNNVHQGHAQNKNKHVAKVTILQNINQT